MIAIKFTRAHQVSNVAVVGTGLVPAIFVSDNVPRFSVVAGRFHLWPGI